MTHLSHINERLHTGLANSGRAAGAGTLYDRYDDESGGRNYGGGCVHVRLPSDSLNPAQRDALNGPVIIIQPAKVKGGARSKEPAPNTVHMGRCMSNG